MSGQQDVLNLDSLARAVDAGADRLRELMLEFEGGINDDTGEVVIGIRAQYEEAIGQKVDEIYVHYEDLGKRPPGEDIRNARAVALVKKERPDLYGRYHALRGSIEIGQRWIAGKRAAMSALQTLNKTGAQLSGVA